MTSDLFAMRSILFLPASNPRAIARARESAADLVVLDLEDAVKPADKKEARAAAVDAVTSGWPMPVANGKPHCMAYLRPSGRQAVMSVIIVMLA